MTPIFSESEWEWLSRRAAKIAADTGKPLAVARSAAIMQLIRLRDMPKAKIYAFRTRMQLPALPACVGTPGADS